MIKFIAPILAGFALTVFLPGVTLAENDGDSTSPSHTTQPLIIAKVSGTLGSNGWYTGNVGVTWLVSDARSAIKSSSGCKAVSITSDTAGTTLTCKAKSAGGTSSKSVTIKRDATLPAETIRTPAVGASYKLGQPIMANYSCSDVMSGVASCVGTVANGVGIDTRTAGNKSFTVTATDKAGNKATRTVS